MIFIKPRDQKISKFLGFPHLYTAYLLSPQASQKVATNVRLNDKDSYDLLGDTI